jgi:GT2 family glycosyltransferase
MVKGQVKIVTMHNARGGSLLNAGAAAARGEVFLFLWPACRLPPDALPAIAQNLRLLLLAIGCNFHLKFDKDALFTRWLAYRLKQQRYKGHYDGHSGIFIRREIFQALEGFKPDNILADYDLARRMESHGPTVYLPEAITISARKLRGRHILKVILSGLIG